MTRITPSDGRARLVGVILLSAVAYLHLPQISTVAGEGAWLMALLYGVLVAFAFATAVGLVRSPAYMVRGFWVFAALLGGTSALLFVCVRGPGVPGLAALRGDWLSFAPLISFYLAAILVVLAAVAMRELTVRGVANRRPRARMVVPAAPAVYMALALALPALAIGAPKGKGTDAIPPAEVAPVPYAPADTDPLLGVPVLAVALIGTLMFVRWAQVTLRRRIAARPALG